MRSILILSFFLFNISFHADAQWSELPGNGLAKRVAVDPSNGALWVVGINDRIYYFSTNKWVEYPGGGKALDIAVYRNTPYVVGIDAKIYYGTGGGWAELSGYGRGRSIAVDASNGTLWATGSSNAKISYYSTNRWVEYPGGGKGTDIAAYQNTPYVIGVDTKIYKGVGQRWEELPGKGHADNIDVDGSNGEVVVKGEIPKAYYFSGGWWRTYPGNTNDKVQDLARHNNVVYIINGSGRIYTNGSGGPTSDGGITSSGGSTSGGSTSDGSTVSGGGTLTNNNYAQLPGGGKAKKIAVDDSNNRVWVIGRDNGIYWYNSNQQRWTQYPGGGRGLDICVRQNTPYIIGMDNRIWRGTETGWQVYSQAKGKEIGIHAESGLIWFIGMDDGIYFVRNTGL